MMTLRVRDYDLGECPLEAYFTVYAEEPTMAVQLGLPDVARRARVAEGHGYCLKPPWRGRKFCFSSRDVEDLDWGTVRALRYTVEDLEAAWVAEVKDACLIANEPCVIAAWCELPLQAVVAILLNLEARGELPDGDD